MQEHKIVVVGDNGTGCTTLIQRFQGREFNQQYKGAISVKTVIKKNGYNLTFWDIAGGERYVNMTETYYKDSTVAIIVVDVTRNSTREGAFKWKKDLNSKIGCPIIVLFNKMDCIFDNDYLNHNHNGFESCYCLDISVKDNIGIDKVLDELINIITAKDLQMNEPTKPIYHSFVLQLHQIIFNEKDTIYALKRLYCALYFDEKMKDIVPSIKSQPTTYNLINDIHDCLVNDLDIDQIINIMLNFGKNNC